MFKCYLCQHSTVSADDLAHRHIQLDTLVAWPHLCQTESGWSMVRGSSRKCSPQFLPIQLWNFMTFGRDKACYKNFACHKISWLMDKILDWRVIFNWSFIYGSSWSSKIKVGRANFGNLIIMIPALQIKILHRKSVLTSDNFPVNMPL